MYGVVGSDRFGAETSGFGGIEVIMYVFFQGAFGVAMDIGWIHFLYGRLASICLCILHKVMFSSEGGGDGGVECFGGLGPRY